MLPLTSVRFQIDNAGIQRLFDQAVRKCRSNLNRFGGDLVLVEGGGYEKIWLETQPGGGEMSAPFNLEAVNDPAFRNAPENNWFDRCWAAR